jgi:trk system potassium uptake protein
MLNIRLCLHYVGLTLLVFSFAMLLPVVVSFLRGTDPYPFIYSFTITSVFGWLVWRSYRDSSQTVLIHRKDSLLIVVLTWFGISIFGALPYILSHVFGPFSLDAVVNALFESSAGFTTTGATVMHHIESVPYDILLWRSLTQWLGGMGIIILAVAILPYLGVGGLELYRAEMPGPTPDKIQPHVAQTAKALWRVYILLTILCFIALAVSGMPLFDAVCHSLTTLATGGFSTQNASIGAYSSPIFEWIIIIFMFLAGCNFVLHYQMARGSLLYFKDQQFKTYGVIIIASVGLILFTNGYNHGFGNWHDEIRTTLFQVVSVITSTGFSTIDYESWPFFSQFVIACLMVIGGCAGSTSGGIKIIRIIVIFRHAINELFRFIHPQSISIIKMNNQAVENKTINGIFGFLTFYFLIFLLATGFLSFFGADFQTSVTAVVSALSNIGPGFGDVGPTENFAFFHPVSKGVLSLCMILGRLELITFVTLCFPEYWKK